MLQITLSLVWLLPIGLLSTLVGVVLCYFFPSPWRRQPQYEFRALIGFFTGIIATAVAAQASHNLLVVIPLGLLAGYIASSLPKVEKTLTAPNDEPATLETPLRDRILFSHDWDARPRYETEEEGVFVGRRELLDRITSDFISKRSGTILISGVRGVGKTALAERALLEAKKKLQNRYWKKALVVLESARFWQPIDVRVREVLLTYASEHLAPPYDYLAFRQAAEEYGRKQSGWFWEKLNPVNRRIQRMVDASRSQLFVLKFNASDIGGALADPTENATSGKPQVSPEKLLRALIRKLFMTCHSSRPKIEAGFPTPAGILQWSLRDKKQQRQFYETLENAYNKSVSKSYKEIISNSLNEAIKESRTAVSEGKVSVEKVLVLVAAVAIGVAGALLGWTRAWRPLESYIASGVATAIAGYIALSWSFKRSRESTSDRARQAQFSYEYDYSLAQMESDLKTILDTIHPPRERKFDRNRAFTRTVVIFDELDKLEDPVKQLNDVITHFKNFFTLSEALFVFLTDHEFYEHLILESAKAQLRRHYSPEHTFFTQKIYLRKPEFSHFTQTVYRFCDPKNLEERVQTASVDPDVIDYVLDQRKELFATIENWPEVQTLTHLYLKRQQYDTEKKEIIERAFTNRAGWSNPMAVAQIWCGLVAAGIEGPELKKAVDAFESIQGWNDPEAVAFLFHRLSLFGEDDRKEIESSYKRLNYPLLTTYQSVDKVPFTLSDLARALCFRTRNHYFDLYYLVYDYVGSYADGAPILHVEDERFDRESRLWSRYQQLVDAAFYHRRVNHPSREYFNALLMESLYSVFDTRAAVAGVKIGSILFSPGKLNSSVLKPPPTPTAAAPVTGSFVLTVPSARAASAASSSATPAAAASNGSPALVDSRDAEQINEAIRRLLRLALARKAINVSFELANQLKADTVKLEAIADQKFYWNDDCEPFITQEGIDLEQYERELIEFWDQNKVGLEALDQELEGLAAFAPLPEESTIQKMKGLIGRLRAMAEGLRRRSITMSRPDASTLKSNIGTPEALTSRVPAFILERIRAAGDAEILLPTETKDGPVETSFRALFESRRTEVDAMGKLPLRAVIFPRESRCLIYLVAGPIPAELDVTLLEPKEDAYVLWYAPAREPAELAKLSTATKFYFPPPHPESLAKLFLDYSLLATKARVLEIVAASRGRLRSDRGLGSRAGAELIGPISPGSEIIKVLTHPAVAVAIQYLNDLPELVNSDRMVQSYQAVGVPQGQKSPPSLVEFGKAFAHFITSSIDEQQKPPFDLETIVGLTISSLVDDPSKLTTESFVEATLSMDTNQKVRALLQSLLNDLLTRKLISAEISDSNFASLVSKEFVPRFLSGIEELAKTNNVELRLVPSYLPHWTAELEKQRLSLKPNVVSTRP